MKGPFSLGTASGRTFRRISVISVISVVLLVEAFVGRAEADQTVLLTEHTERSADPKTPHLTPHPSVSAVMDKMDTLFRSRSSRGRLRVEIDNKRYNRTLEMNIVTLGLDYSLVTITHPRKEKGISTLKRRTEIWNHLPRINRNIRLPPSMMSESWMGSDLTNDDLVREVSWRSDYTHSRVNPAKGTAGLDVSDALDCFASEPKPDVPVTWSRVETCVQAETVLPVFQNFYDDKKRLARKILFSDVKTLGGRTIPTQITVLPQLEDSKGQSTTLTYLEMSFDAPVSESEFQVSRLGERR